jgi:magnesium chelatase subunit I
VQNVFHRHLDLAELDLVIDAFDGGLAIETGELVPSARYVRWLREVPGLAEAVGRLGVTESPASAASAIEFILEGLHLNRRLNKDRTAAGGRYRG